MELDRAGDIIRGFDPVLERIKVIKRSPDGAAIIGYCGGRDFNLLMWDVASGRRVESFYGPTLSGVKLFYDPFELGDDNTTYRTDGRFIYFRGNNRCDAKTGEVAPGIPWHGMSADSYVLAAPRCPWLLVADAGGTCHILDSAGERCLATLPSRIEYEGAAVISPDGRLLFAPTGVYGRSSDRPPGVAVWDIGQCKLLRHLSAPGDIRGETRAITADGRRWIYTIGIQSADHAVDLAVCDMLTGKQLAILDCEGCDLQIRGTSQDGRFLFCQTPGPLLLYDLSSLPQSTP